MNRLRTHTLTTFPVATRPVVAPTTVGVTRITPDEARAPDRTIILLTDVGALNTGRPVTQAIAFLANAIRARLSDPLGRPLATQDPETLVWLVRLGGALEADVEAETPDGTLSWVDLYWDGRQYRIGASSSWDPVETLLIDQGRPAISPCPLRLRERLPSEGLSLLQEVLHSDWALRSLVRAHLAARAEQVVPDNPVTEGVPV